MATLYEPSRLERKLAAALRSLAVRAIDQFGVEMAAARLNLATVAVDALVWQSEWPLERAVRVAEALDVLSDDAVDALAAA